MSQKVKILGVAFDPLNKEELTKKLNSMLDGDGRGYLVTPNPEILMCACKDREYRCALNSAALSIADGVGVVWAAKKLGIPIKERIPGVELGEEVLALSAQKGLGVYFLGGKEGIAAEAARRMQKKYVGLDVCGTHHGYFKDEENTSIISSINDSGAEVLYICTGFPFQEKWINKNIQYLTNVKLALCLGGSLDIYAGSVRRAPSFICRCGLEWAWRAFTSVTHFCRALKLPFYIISICKERKTRNS